jgi:hypothetical protein
LSMSFTSSSTSSWFWFLPLLLPKLLRWSTSIWLPSSLSPSLLSTSLL